VRSPRELKRFYAHVVQPYGRPIALDALYPAVEPESFIAVAGQESGTGIKGVVRDG
jgi:hypothetical protein